MTKEITKYGKRIVLDIEKSNHIIGNVIIKNRFMKHFFIIAGIYFISSIWSIFYNEGLAIFLGLVYIGIFFLDFKYLKRLYKTNFPDYYLFVRWNEKISKDFILKHELLHIKVREKLLNDKELNDEFERMLDNLTYLHIKNRLK